jgi:hypothetical protein
MEATLELSEIVLPNQTAFAFGVGLERLTGTTKNLAVQPTQSTPSFALGSQQTFKVARADSTSDLQRSLGIDVSASYGCASFGAGASARFAFAEDSEVHSSCLFMTIVCTVECPDLSINEAVLTDAASQIANDAALFEQRYGNMFARACKTGGMFVALMRVETFDDAEASKIEAELHGTYGLFSADAKAKFSSVAKTHNANVYCTVYSEGGPLVQVANPGDPAELLEHANSWLKALYDDPAKYAHAYEWTFSPMSIVEGPLPPNAADILHSQDVLMFCSTERVVLLDQVNRLNWWGRHVDKYDWSDSDGVEKIAAAATATQLDLDLIAACASRAMNDPGNAQMPADFALSRGGKYPISVPLPKLPKSLPLTTTPQSTGSQSVKASMIGLSGLVCLLAKSDGKVYAVGSSSANYSRGPEEYDPIANKWSTMDPMPAQYKGGSVVLTADDTLIFSFIDLGSGKGRARLGEYNPKTRELRLTSPMPTNRTGTSLVVGKANNIYALGGWSYQDSGGPSTLLETVEEYSLASDTWSVRAPYHPPQRSSIGVAAGLDGKLYVAGGFGHIAGLGLLSSYGSLAILDEYDPATDTWTIRSPMRVARGGAGLCVGRNGRLYAVGGYSAIPARPITSPPQELQYNISAMVEEYDPVADTWTEIAPLATSRGYPGLVVLEDGSILVAGGNSGWGSDARALQDIEELSS